jgi:hypothetical protein
LLTGDINAWLANGERTELAAQLIEIPNQETKSNSSLIFHKGIFQKFSAAHLYSRITRDITGKMAFMPAGFPTA